MNKRTITYGIVALLGVIAVELWLATPAALATQTHGEPEGLMVHQIAHLFFIFSMGTLIYWLRARRLTDHHGWRLIQYAALLLILWNLDAFVVHLLDEQVTLIRTARQGGVIHIQAAPGFEMLGPIYYLVKLDHLLCVPALILLLQGLRRLVKDTREGAAAGDAP